MGDSEGGAVGEVEDGKSLGTVGGIVDGWLVYWWVPSGLASLVGY